MIYAWVLFGVLCAGSIASAVLTRDEAASSAAADGVASTEPKAQAHLVNDFSGFAGSESNARNLVTGLLQGSEIMLVAPAGGGQPGPATRFMPPTRPMDYGDVHAALILAREQLVQLGITRPTPVQIKAVLAGGGIASRANGLVSTPFLHPGVLQMRAGGMRWAKIAGTMGVNLEQVSSGGAYVAGVTTLPDSLRPAAARAAGGVVPAAAPKSEARAVRRTAAAPAPISSPSITQSRAGGATNRAAIKPAARVQADDDEPVPVKRRSKARVMVAAQDPGKAKGMTVSAPDSAPAGAARTQLAPAAAAVSDDLSVFENNPPAERN